MRSTNNIRLARNANEYFVVSMVDTRDERPQKSSAHPTRAYLTIGLLRDPNKPELKFSTTYIVYCTRKCEMITPNLFVNLLIQRRQIAHIGRKKLHFKYGFRNTYRTPVLTIVPT